MTIRLEIRGRIAEIVLDRPDVNALDREHMAALHAAVTDAAGDPQIRAILIYGANNCFSAGADIREMDQSDPAVLRAYAPELQAHLTCPATTEIPVCVAIEGFALGGGLELALAADIRVAASDAALALPEITLGVIPGAGGTQRLAAHLGPQAKYFLMTGKTFRAGWAKSNGLVDILAEPGTAVEVARAFLRPLTNAPRAGLAAIKCAVDGRELPENYRRETNRFADLFGTADQLEGMRAFLDKRRPDFAD